MALNDTVATKAAIMPWKHLHTCDLTTAADISNTVGVGLLVGPDNDRAFKLLKVRTGSEAAPFAIRTRPGWTVNGPVGHTGPNAVVECSMDFALPQGEDIQLEVQVRRFWEMETEAERAKNDEYIALSINDDQYCSCGPHRSGR